MTTKLAPKLIQHAVARYAAVTALIRAALCGGTRGPRAGHPHPAHPQPLRAAARALQTGGSAKTSASALAAPAGRLRRVATLAGCGALLALVAACHGLPQKSDEISAWPDNKLYTEAQDAYNGKDWGKCAKYFEALQGRNPTGRFAQQAQINVAYCDWRDSELDAADQAVNRFIQLHPSHPDIAYAYYLKGLIHFNDDLGLLGRFSGQDMSERDPDALRQSYDSFKIVVERYPDSKYAPDAAQRMRYIVNALASHDVHAADYYYRRGAYIAAVNRAQLALQEYRSAPAIEDALHIMILSYQKLGKPTLADDTRRVLAQTFPDSPYVTGHARRPDKKKSWWQF